MDWVPWILTGGCALALCIALVGWWRAATRVGRANRARGRIAARGELEAEGLLAANGYTVLDRQITSQWWLEVDGEPVPVTSRADLLVSSFGERLIAEVKTGDRAPDPKRPATRRQLMEYLHVFDVDGVLLVDMERGVVRRVTFP